MLPRVSRATGLTLTLLLGMLTLIVPASAAAAPEKRIVGGTETTIEEWPWQAALLDAGAGNAYFRQFCGGSVIAGNLVLTAAHCVETTQVGPEPIFGPPEDVEVLTGRTTLSDSSQGQESALETYYVFTDEGGGEVGYESFENFTLLNDDPLYDPQTSRWDVVVLELAEPVPAAPIQLAGAGETSLWAPGVEATVTGWGTTCFSSCSGSNTLRETTVDMLDDSICDATYSDYDFATMVCAGALEGGRDTCQGDSGGPLVVPVQGAPPGATPSQSWRLVGDTSFGAGCAEPDTPAVYGRVAGSQMRPAIERVIAEQGSPYVDPNPPPPPDPDPEPEPTPEPEPAPDNRACERAENRLDRAEGRLKKAKRQLRRKVEAERPRPAIRDARRKVKRVKRKVERRERRVARACA